MNTITSLRPNDLRNLDRLVAKDLVNERLKELLEAQKPVSEFKCEKLNMSNSSAHQIMTQHFGFIKCNTTRLYREQTEADILTRPTSNSKHTNTAHNILDSIRNTETTEKKSTSFMICVDTREDWNNFCKKYYMLDKTLLFDAALRMFMRKFED